MMIYFIIERRKITVKARMHAEICWSSRRVFADGGKLGEYKAQSKRLQGNCSK